MRKLSLLLAICLMLVCFVSCKDDQKDEGSTTDGGIATTQSTGTTEAPTDDESTKTPETPQDKWTGRY